MSGPGLPCTGQDARLKPLTQQGLVYELVIPPYGPAAAVARQSGDVKVSLVCQ